MKTETIIFLNDCALPLLAIITLLWIAIGGIAYIIKVRNKKRQKRALFIDESIAMITYSLTYGLIGGSGIPLAISIYLLYVERLAFFYCTIPLVPTFVIGILILSLKILSTQLNKKRLS